MTVLPWAKWPALQKERVRREVGLRMDAAHVGTRHEIICAALYELYPYAVTDATYDDLVRDIYADIKSNQQ
jgi:hypothetical protein